MIGEIVNRLAPQFNLDPRIVVCVILQESNGNPWANRFEQGLFDLLAPLGREKLSGWRPSPGELPTLITEKYNRACSWGLMQVLGETARWLCRLNNPYLTCLSEPELGIAAGCRVLEYYRKLQHGDISKALAMYNAGNPKSVAGLEYVKKIMSRFNGREYVKVLTDA